MNKNKKDGVVYHITYTDKVSKIQRQGLTRMNTSNWVVAGTKGRYGNGEVYAFQVFEDAIKWGLKMDWEFNQKFGSGKISVLTVADDGQWDIDKNDPLGQAMSKGHWYKRNTPIAAKKILSTQIVTKDLL